MFGEKASEEKFKTALNRFVLTRIDAHNRTFWVYHTKAESPVSVLIQDLVKARVLSDEVMALVGSSQFKMILDPKEYESLKENEVLVWGSTTKATIESLVKKATQSNVLAYEKRDGE